VISPANPFFVVRFKNSMIPQLSHTTKEEFIRDAIRFKLTMLSQGYEYIEIPKEQFGLLNEAVKEMSAPYYTTEDFVNTQIKEAIGEYQEWKRMRKSVKKNT